MKNITGTDLIETWTLWRECLLGNDPNSIYSQISFMVWDAALFRLIMESRRIQLQNHPDFPELNVRLHHFIDWNFFVAQTAAIRRLLDTYGLRGTKGVLSLHALISFWCERDHIMNC